MKRIISIIILVILLFAGLFILTGCSDIFSTNNTTNTTNTSKYNTTEVKTYSASNISTATNTTSTTTTTNTTRTTKENSVFTNSKTTGVTEPQKTETTYTYILNKNTKKFHYPSCSSVRQMKDSNKRVYEGSRDDVIGMGYTPCQRCYP